VEEEGLYLFKTGDENKLPGDFTTEARKDFDLMLGGILFNRLGVRFSVSAEGWRVCITVGEEESLGKYFMVNNRKVVEQ
jgi:hypothetical protein